MSGAAPDGGSSVKSLRNIWQQRADQTVKEKDKEQQPPPSPSSKASAALNNSTFDPFSVYGITFTTDQGRNHVVSPLNK